MSTITTKDGVEIPPRLFHRRPAGIFRARGESVPG
jgi:hypothetical protein